MTTTNEINGVNGADGHIMNLPDSKSSTLALVQPTEEEKLVFMKENGASWKGALELGQYIRREKYLAKQDFTRNGGITYWVLIDTAGKDRLVLSSCETLRKRTLVARNGKVEDAVGHGIGSVWCPSWLRRRGYAGRMMAELAKKLEDWQADEQEIVCSILYSDIGKKFYAQYGWQPFPSSHVSVPAEQSPNPALNGSSVEARPLYASDLPDLCAIDEQLIRQSMQAAPRGKTVLTFIPEIALIRWHHAREEFVGNEIRGEVPDIKGAIVGSEKGKRVWCYWTRMWYNEDPQSRKGNTLHVLRLVIEEHGMYDWERVVSDEEASQYVPAIAALLRMAQEEACKWNMATVDLWNPTYATITAAQNVSAEAQLVDREMDSITSLRWHGLLPESSSAADRVDWIGNEKHTWC